MTAVEVLGRALLEIPSADERDERHGVWGGH